MLNKARDRSLIIEALWLFSSGICMEVIEKTQTYRWGLAYLGVVMLALVVSVRWL